MANSGADKLIATLLNLPEKFQSETLRSAVMAGAREFQKAITAAAPPRSDKDRPGWKHTADAIIVYERKPKQSQDIGVVSSFLIGPAKKAPQGFWREKGRRGFVVKPLKYGGKKYLSWIGKDGKRVFTKRANVGPQPARKWVEPAFNSALASALKTVKDRLSEAVAKIGKKS